MKHAAAFTLLLTIAGTPVTTLMCIGWCAPDATPAGVSCHHHGSGAGARVIDTDDSCAQLLVASPVINEDLQLNRTATTVRTPYAFSGAQADAKPARVHNVAPAVSHRVTLSLVLRL